MALQAISAEIESARAKSAHAAQHVQLVAVSKMQDAAAIMPLLEAGHRVFGENRVQETAGKWPALRAQYGDIQLHLIGHLQTNKAKDAVALFDVIETIDSGRIALVLSEEMQKQDRNLACFIQVNTGEEAQKDGIAPRDVEKLLRVCREDAGLNIKGLMCIPPAGELPDMHFALLHKLAHESGLPSLSMGMSADFKTAIRYGATHVRIGTALFGARESA